MKRLALVAATLLALAAWAARPGTEQQLVQQLNGQPVRPVMADGGAWGIFATYDAGTANSLGCAPLTGLTNNVGGAVTPNLIVFMPLAPLHICVMPSVNNPMWDGGCDFATRSRNYGMPVATGVPQYITPDSAATRICAVSDAGFVELPLWWAQ